MLADARAVEATVIESGGLDAMPHGALWIQSSTIGVAATERLADLAGERGITFVDAPVLGTKKPAEDGQLFVLASGPEDARRTLRAGLRRDFAWSRLARRGRSGDDA